MSQTAASSWKARAGLIFLYASFSSAVAADLLHAGATLVFLLAALGIIPLAGYLGAATDDIAGRSGPALGGLLNATFGNAPELIIGLFAVQAGLLEVVKASLTGSIMGNLLLVLGMAFLVGGIRHRRQQFNRTAALASSSMLFLAVVALVVPAIFLQTAPGASAAVTEQLSLLVAFFMIVLYAAYLLFIFHTHPHLYTEDLGKFRPRWSLRGAIGVLTGTTIGVVWLSEILISTLRPAISHLGWTELFVGAVVVAIIGNVAEHASAVAAAHKNRLELSLQIAIGSATQIALFVVPVLVFASILMGHPLSLNFGSFELVAIILSVMMVNLVVLDGETNWLEGAQLLAAYAVLAAGFFLHP